MSLTQRVNARDAGLRRIKQMTRWAVGGGLALSGGFAALAAQGFTGHTTRVATGPVASGDSSTAAVAPTGTPAPQPTAGVSAVTAPAATAPAALAPPTTAPRSAVRTHRPTSTTTTPAYVDPNQTYYVPSFQPPSRPQVSSGGS